MFDLTIEIEYEDKTTPNSTYLSERIIKRLHSGEHLREVLDELMAAWVSRWEIQANKAIDNLSHGEMPVAKLTIQVDNF